MNTPPREMTPRQRARHALSEHPGLSLFVSEDELAEDIDHLTARFESGTAKTVRALRQLVH
jgi:hypothetical protein